MRGSAVDIRVPQRGDKKNLMQTVARNAGQALVLHKTRRAGDLTTRSQALNEIQEALGLSEAPLRIECYDVSNLQGTEVVASMVVFEDGLPRKSEYRRFAIKGVEGQDDTASIHEVITRRFTRYLADRGATRQAEDDVTDASAEQPVVEQRRRFAYPPQLVVVDGGPPQVAAAARALAELGVVDVALCGLAKRLEEVWLPGEEYPTVLPRTSEGLYLLQRVRDEAHRFAITFHRQRRSKAMTSSVLDDVPGLGPARRKALLKHFGSVKRLRAADVEEVAQVPGLGRATAGPGGGAPRPRHRAAHPGRQHRHRRGGRRRAGCTYRSARGRRGWETGAVTASDPEPASPEPDLSDEASVPPGAALVVPEVLVVTGMSGAGRSTTADVLEDLGWYVVDNLPPTMLAPLATLASHAAQRAAQARGRGRRPRRVVLHRPARRPHRPQRQRRPHPGALPRRLRRVAGAPVRVGAPAAPAAGPGPHPRRHRRASATWSATCAAPPTW